MKNVISLLTPPGTAAITVFYIEGRSAIDCLKRAFTPAVSRSQDTADVSMSDGSLGVSVDNDALSASGSAGASASQPLSRLVAHRFASHRLAPQLGTLRDAHGVIDQVILLRESGHDVAELHCHGGRRIMERVLMLFQQHGVEIVPWQELCDSQSIKGEVAGLLPRATTPMALRAIAAQHPGGLTAWARDIAHRAAAPSADLSQLKQAADEVAGSYAMARRWLNGARVVLLGQANAGKSTLANALAGTTQSLAHHLPGTTRDWTRSQITLAGLPVTLIDTAGLIADSEAHQRHPAVAEPRAGGVDGDTLVDDCCGGPDGTGNHPVAPTSDTADLIDHLAGRHTIDQLAQAELILHVIDSRQLAKPLLSQDREKAPSTRSPSARQGHLPSLEFPCLEFPSQRGEPASPRCPVLTVLSKADLLTEAATLSLTNALAATVPDGSASAASAVDSMTAGSTTTDSKAADSTTVDSDTTDSAIHDSVASDSTTADSAAIDSVMTGPKPGTSAVVTLSAITGQGLDELRNTMAALLGYDDFDPAVPRVFTARQYQLLRQAADADELPSFIAAIDRLIGN